eukprot:scaffold303938_cov21-Tisochrysis_lutea.AAC.1
MGEQLKPKESQLSKGHGQDLTARCTQQSPRASVIDVSLRSTVHHLMPLCIGCFHCAMLAKAANVATTAQGYPMKQARGELTLLRHCCLHIGTLAAGDNNGAGLPVETSAGELTLLRHRCLDAEQRLEAEEQ